MMVTRELTDPPRLLPLYARTVAPLLPGASRLPWIGGAGKEIPDLALSLTQVRADPARVAEYSRVCAFATTGALPATYVHVLAFPLHLALMADGAFPFAAVGLVHVANRIAQQRPIRLDERLDLRVHATPLRAHPRGRVFSLVTEGRVADELVWRELSTMLRRGRGTGTAAAGTSADAPANANEDAPANASADAPANASGEAPAGAPTGAGETSEESAFEALSAALSAEWRLPGDLGRRYAAVSGDRNPIHLHPLGARALGFPRAIAHGMWTMARCLAALQESGCPVPAGAFSVEVRFRRPILLPASVGFASASADDATVFGVRDGASGTNHLDGRVMPIEAITSEREDAR
jgi:acyl dehydratase